MIYPIIFALGALLGWRRAAVRGGDRLDKIHYAAIHGKAILVKKALASGHACLQPGIDPVQASFELVFGHPGVSSAIVGTINPVHLAHNVACAAGVLKALG